MWIESLTGEQYQALIALHDTLMSETVPRFRPTWVECLGDLARYRHVEGAAPAATR